MKKSRNQREVQICRYVAEGWSNRAIARRLRLSEQTVKNYLGEVFRKLRIENRVKLAIMSSAEGKNNPIWRIAGKPKRVRAS